MILEWIITTTLASLCAYLIVMVFYYKSLLRKEELSGNITINTLGDAEIVIRKYQIQLQRSLGNIDILSEELLKAKDELKSMRTKNSQFRMEGDKLREQITELKSKIEALL
ncbi:MAG: hypothetical protein JJV95_06930 [Sulfurospirillum sp.]|nr:hypothetical protein [Sulfurospirillum sp.]MBL0703697.1 hypothetical protein [Sulfurospirillum sp.]